jgi:hypothetical protein
VGFLIVVLQMLCVLGLLYGLITVFSNWPYSGRFWGDVDPILASEVPAIADRLSCADDSNHSDFSGGLPQLVSDAHAT